MDSAFILQVADEIEGDGRAVPHFNMGDWIALRANKRPVSYPHKDGRPATRRNLCTSAGCIAGHVSALHVPHPRGMTLGEFWLLDHDDRAQARMGLSDRQSRALFTPDTNDGLPDISYERITRQHAAAVLRHLAMTGEVDWSVGYQGEKSE